MAEPTIIDGNTLFGYWGRRDADISLETLLAILGEHKVARACTLATNGIFGDFRQGNDATWQAAEKHSQLIPVATLDPRRHLGCPEEIKQRRDQGFKLFAFFPELQGWPIASQPFPELLKAVAEAGGVVMVEARVAGAPGQIAQAGQGLKIPIILSGVGYENLAEALAVMKQDERIHLETHRLTCADGLELVAGEVGAQRLIFGSYSPLNYFSSSFLMVKFSQLSDGDKAGVLGGNLARLLEAD